MDSAPPSTAEPEPPPTALTPEPPVRPDRDFLPDPFPAPRWPSGFDPVGHQRLVVNPFLALAVLIAVVFVGWHLLRSEFPPLALGVLPVLGALPWLVHWHCLDCGATSSFPRWRLHACPRVALRADSDRPRWFRWPRAATQLVVWLYILGAGTLLTLVIALSFRHRWV